MSYTMFHQEALAAYAEKLRQARFTAKCQPRRNSWIFFYDLHPKEMNGDETYWLTIIRKRFGGATREKWVIRFIWRASMKQCQSNFFAAFPWRDSCWGWFCWFCWYLWWANPGHNSQLTNNHRHAEVRFQINKLCKVSENRAKLWNYLELVFLGSYFVRVITRPCPVPTTNVTLEHPRMTLNRLMTEPFICLFLNPNAREGCERTNIIQLGMAASEIRSRHRSMLLFTPSWKSRCLRPHFHVWMRVKVFYLRHFL